MQDPNAPLSPNDSPALLEVLSRAMSPADEIRKPASATLKQLETRPGFVSLLLHLSQTSPQDPHVHLRQFASIQLKNVVVRNWRSGGNIHENERISLRQSLLGRLQEQNPHVAEQLLVVIGKIAREDFPERWPALLDTLMQQATAPHAPFVTRTMNKIFKTLSSKRKGADRRVYSDLANRTLPYLVPHWSKRQADLFQAIAAAAAAGAGAANASSSSSTSATSSAAAAATATSAISNPATADALYREATSCLYLLKSICRLVHYGQTSLRAGTITCTFLSDMLTTVQTPLPFVLDDATREGHRRVSSGKFFNLCFDDHKNIYILSNLTYISSSWFLISFLIFYTGDSIFSLDEGTDDEEKKTLVGRLRGMIEVSLETLCRLFGRAPLSFRPYLPTFLTLSRTIIVDHGQRIATSGDLARRYEVPSLLACRFLSKCVAERKFEMLGDGDGDVTQEQVEGMLLFLQ